MTKRITIVQVQYDWDVPESFEDMQTSLEHLKKNYPDGKLRFVKEFTGYDGGYQIDIYNDREETDEEYQARLALEEARIAKNREPSRATKMRQYKKLKKELGL